MTRNEESKNVLEIHKRNEDCNATCLSEFHKISLRWGCDPRPRSQTTIEGTFPMSLQGKVPCFRVPKWRSIYGSSCLQVHINIYNSHTTYNYS